MLQEVSECTPNTFEEQEKAQKAGDVAAATSHQIASDVNASTDETGTKGPNQSTAADTATADAHGSAGLTSSSSSGIYSIDVVPDFAQSEPAYIITTRVLRSTTDGSIVTSASTGPKNFARFSVLRTLRQMEAIKAEFLKREPYAFFAQLPSASNGSSLRSVDQILGMLYFMSSSPHTSSDPLFWSLLTGGDGDEDDLDAQWEAMGVKTKTATDEIKDLIATKLKTKHPMPQKEIKPSAISDAMIKTPGMVERTFLTFDKISVCVEATLRFEKLREQRRARHAAWTDANAAMYQLRSSLEEMKDASKDVAEAFRNMCASNYWPWTREKVVEAESKPKLSPRIHPAHRLTHYMHRVANNTVEVGRTEGTVMSEEFASSTALEFLSEDAFRYNCGRCLEHFHQIEPPKPNGNSLVELGLIAQKIAENGKGMTELDPLDQLDAEVSEIHDISDEVVAKFEDHFSGVKGTVDERTLRHLRELQVSQSLNWTSTLMIVKDLKLALDVDLFMDDEDLPIVEKTETPDQNSDKTTAKSIASLFQPNNIAWVQQMLARRREASENDEKRELEEKAKRGETILTLNSPPPISGDDSDSETGGTRKIKKNLIKSAFSPFGKQRPARRHHNPFDIEGDETEHPDDQEEMRSWKGDGQQQATSSPIRDIPSYSSSGGSTDPRKNVSAVSWPSAYEEKGSDNPFDW